MRRLLLICVALVATLLFTVPSAAQASYGSVLPEGLTKSSKVAKQRINQLMDIDHGVRQAVARNHRLPAVSLMGAKVRSIKRSSAVLGSRDGSNSARASSGSIVPTSYKAGQKVMTWTVVLKLRDGRTIVDKWKYDCSNPLLRTVSPPPLRIVTKVKTFRMKFSKSKVTKRATKCPSGQRVGVRVRTTVRGKIKFRVLTKAVKLVERRLKAKLRVQVKNTIRIRCGKAPKKVVPPPPAQVNKCSAGMVIDANGNCVNQTNSAEQNCKAIGGTWSGSTQLCTIIQINANCSNVTVVNGSGNVVSTHQEGNCNNTPPPPSAKKCPDGKPIPPEGCDNPPHVDVFNSPAHLYVNGIFYVFIEAWDPDGDDVSVSTSASGQGTITLPTPVDVRWDGSPCPAGKSCYRARVQASSTPGSLTLTFTVRAGGKSETRSVTLPVVPDDF